MFIIRSVNDEELRETSSIILVAVSLIASLFSIANKYCWLDKDGFEHWAQDPEFKKKCPCVNPWYILRIIWRVSYVTTRFCILSLVWTVLGGVFLIIFLVLSFCAWCGSFRFISEEHGPEIKYALMWGISSLIATPTSDKIASACIHGCEMIILLTVITIFGYVEFDCIICADAQDRQASNNPYIQMFIIAGWITMVIDFIAYGIILNQDLLSPMAWWSARDMFEKGAKEIEMPETTTS